MIEPSQLKRRSIKKKHFPYKPFIAVFVVLGVTAGLWAMIKPQKITPVKQDTIASTKEVKSATKTVEPAKTGKFKQFTNTEFVKFYSSFAYPNTTEITTPPTITGNEVADKRIQTIAESRGYKLRSAPVSPPVLLEDGFYIQQKALQSLLDMKAAAKKKGLSLVITASFRSIDEQRALFLPRLQQEGASPESVAAGTADLAVEGVLKTVAAPGYSRHHNGFTIDLACGPIGGLAFLTTDCYKWLSDGNFANAKEYGWIPSYPQGTSSTGPEPEPWEYVWVGKDALLE